MEAGVSEAAASADDPADTDTVSLGLAAGRGEGEPLGVAATQPAVNNAVRTMAVHLRHLRLPRNADFTGLPLRKAANSETRL